MELHKASTALVTLSITTFTGFVRNSAKPYLTLVYLVMN